MDARSGVKVAPRLSREPQMRCATLYSTRPRVAEETSLMPSQSQTHPHPPKVGHWSEPALRVLRERYLAREHDDASETPEEMCWRVARAIAAAEERFGRSPAAVDEVAAAFYDMMVEGYFLPNSPTL